MVQLGQNRTHAVIPKPSCVVGGRNKAAAQRVHFCQRTDLSGITEIIGEFSSCETGAGGRFYGDNLVIRFSPEFFSRKRRDQPSQIGAAPGAADNHIRLNAVFLHGGFGFQPNDCLVQKNLVQDAAQNIAVTLL